MNHHIPHRHNHLVYHVNNISLVVAGLVIEVMSAVMDKAYPEASQLVFLVGTLTVMVGLYLLKHSKEDILRDNPVVASIGLLIFQSLSFIVFPALFAIFVFGVFFFFTIINFDVTRAHVGLRGNEAHDARGRR